MRRGWVGITLALVGGSGGGSDEADGGEDAGGIVVPSEDAGAPAPVDAGPLWQTCDPASPGSCPSGRECLGAHTSPVDAYGTCVFTCAGANEPLCAASGGTCACPTVGYGPGSCSVGNEAGEVTVCAPFGEGGAPGTNEVEDAGEAPSDATATDAPG